MNSYGRSLDLWWVVSGSGKRGLVKRVPDSSPVVLDGYWWCRPWVGVRGGRPVH